VDATRKLNLEYCGRKVHFPFGTYDFRGRRLKGGGTGSSGVAIPGVLALPFTFSRIAIILII